MIGISGTNGAKRMSNGLGRAMLRRSYLIAGIGLVILVGWALSPYFLTVTNVRNIIVTGAVVSILAVGQFTVIVTAGIDLSVGSVAALGSVIVAVLLRDGSPLVVAVLITLLICGATGVVDGVLVVYGKITPFIVTLAMLSIAEGAAFIVQGGTLIVITRQDFVSFFSGNLLGIPSPVYLFVAVTVIFAVIMRWTVFGRQLYAIGGNREAARLSGLPVRRNLVLAYTISGVLAGLAGLVLAAQLSEGNSLLASGYELNAIAAAVVGGASLFGGAGSPVTSVLGGLLIGTISNIMDLRGIQEEPQLIIQGSIILLAVYMTSGGGGSLRAKLEQLLIGRRPANAAGVAIEADQTAPSAAALAEFSLVQSLGTGAAASTNRSPAQVAPTAIGQVDGAGPRPDEPPTGGRATE